MDSKLDLSSELLQICIGEFQLQFHFANGHIFVESWIEHKHETVWRNGDKMIGDALVKSIGLELSIITISSKKVIVKISTEEFTIGRNDDFESIEILFFENNIELYL